MKILSTALLLLASSAFACPDISGLYSCQLSSATIQKEIKETETGYIIISEGNEMEYVTDGKGYEIPATDSYKDAIVTSFCRNDQLVVDFKANILYEGSVIANEVAKTIYKMAGDNLVILRKTKMKGIPLPTQKYLCSKIKSNG